MHDHATSQFTLHSLTDADLAVCHHLSLALKWPHRLEDWQFVHVLRDMMGKARLVA